MQITKRKVLEKLEEVMDPEIHMSITDLGLVYEVKVEKNKVTVLMTLTTIGCPLFSLIESEVRAKLRELGFKDEDMKLELTFDPPWSVEKMSERGRAILGI